MSTRHTMSRDRLRELQGPDNSRGGYSGYDDYPPPPPPAQTRYNTPPPPSPGRYNNNPPPSPGRYDNGYNDRYNQRQPDRYDPYAQDNSFNAPPPRQNYNQTPPPRGASGRGNYGGGGDYEMRSVGGGPGDFSSPQGFFDEVDSIRGAIDQVNDTIVRIQELHSSSLSNISDEQAAQTERQIDMLKSQTQKQNAKIKERIKAIEISNAKMPKAADIEMRRTQHAALKKRFIETIQKYSDTERNFSTKYRQRVERQIRIVKPDASPEEIEDIIDSDQPQIFAQSLLNSNRSGQARAVLAEVQSRHDDIKKIEKTILELHQLFVEMNQLVELQGETIDIIDQHAEETVIQLEEGNKHIDKAVVSARQARAKKWWCLGISIIILAVAALMVYLFVVKPNLDSCHKILC